MASIITVDNETNGTSFRVTRGGRKITYEMTVVQQPERARACGQGAKSSTDRRPVDPPPIVDLRIFEGEEGSKREVTCFWNANFFLYASLEQARSMAQGRVAPSVSNSPVLTGSPVAGMSYLDRPAPAGYFIFPDLSVRHEGKYRLSFQLFEEIRDENDKDPVEQAPPIAGGTGEAYIGRCQVKSKPFTVYSAKKFPGLAESTTLSRMVADQGCRVRIRRDVRMRRRTDKDSKDWDDYEEKTVGDRNRRTASPDAQQQAMAVSPDETQDTVEGAKAASRTGHNMAPERQPHDMHHQYQQYQQGYAPPQAQPSAPQHAYAPQVQYDPSSVSQYHHPQYMPQQQQHVVQSPQQMTPYQQQYQYGYQQPMIQYGQGYYTPQHQQPQPPQQYDHQMSHMRQDTMNYGPLPLPPQQYQPQSMPPPPYNQQAPLQQVPLGPPGHGYIGRMTQDPSPTYPSQLQPSAAPTPTTAPQQSASTIPNGNNDLPPLKTLDPFPSAKFDGPNTNGMPPSVPNAVDIQARAPQPIYAREQSYPDPAVAPPPQYITASTGIAPKRAYGMVFSTLPTDQRLHAGARPGTAGGLSPQDMPVTAGDDGSDEDVLDMESLKMQYRRADGTQVNRRWPVGR